MERKYIKYGVLAGVIFLFMILMNSCFFTEEKETPMVERGSTVGEETNASTVNTCLVYVVGAVMEPGVYELPEGSRVYDAVKMAGDVLPYAAMEDVNMAADIHDGEKIYIPLDPYRTSPDAIGKVNINSAGREELQVLPGVGVKTAEKIISYRENHGLFKTKEELKEVPTLGEKKYGKLSSKVTL